jgi:hypothetical protein
MIADSRSKGLRAHDIALDVIKLKRSGMNLYGKSREKNSFDGKDEALDGVHNGAQDGAHVEGEG